MSSRTPSTAAATGAASATDLMAPTASLGITSITNAPTSGRKMVRIRPQSFRNSFIGFGSPCRSSADDHHEHAGQDRHCGEEQRCILLDASGLRQTQRATRLAGAETGTVDRTVDDRLVDVLVDPATGADRTATD